MERLETLDLLLRNYNDCGRVLSMPYKDAIKLVAIINERERRERFYRQWLMYLPNMTKDTYVSFADYYEQVTVPSIDTRPTEVIMRELLEG